MRYGQVYDGEWIKPKTRRGHRIACCDCGLVHVFDFTVRKGVLYYRPVRDQKATAARRRRLRSGHGAPDQPTKEKA